MHLFDYLQIHRGYNNFTARETGIQEIFKAWGVKLPLTAYLHMWLICMLSKSFKGKRTTIPAAVGHLGMHSFSI